MAPDQTFQGYEMRLIVFCVMLLTIAFMRSKNAAAQDKTDPRVKFSVMPDSDDKNKTFLAFCGSADWVLQQDHPSSRWASMSIEGISLNCIDFKLELVDYVSRLKQVRWLEFSCIAAETTLRSGMYDPIGKMTQLRYLDLLYDERLLPPDLNFLGSLLELRDLTITPGDIEVSSWQLITKNENLKNLRITGINAASIENGIVPTAQTKFENLYLGDVPSSIDLERLLGNQPQLKILSFRLDKMSTENVRYLQSLPQQIRIEVNGGVWRDNASK